MKKNIDLKKVNFVNKFESWFAKKYGIRIEDYELKIQKGKFGVKHEVEGEDDEVIDDEEQAYFNAKKKIASISKARKTDTHKRKK